MAFRYAPDADLTASAAELLVNNVNCVGVMGAGLARSFARRWPGIVAPYAQDCREGRVQPGKCYIYTLPDGRLWAALTTKNHWRDLSRLEWVRRGLEDLAVLAAALPVRTIAIAPPGCGLGGLPWASVEPILLAALAGFDITIQAPPARRG